MNKVSVKCMHVSAHTFLIDRRTHEKVRKLTLYLVDIRICKWAWLDQIPKFEILILYN